VDKLPLNIQSLYSIDKLKTEQTFEKCIDFTISLCYNYRHLKRERIFYIDLRKAGVIYEI